MSGNPTFSPRDKGLHFQAARDWLDRAEKQFSGGESVMASATLMLAQAELRLLVESVASGSVIATVERGSRPRGHRLLPMARTLLGAAALAACMLIGLAVGRITAPQQAQFPGVVPGSIHMASTAEPQVQPSAQPVEPEVQKPNIEQTVQSGGEEILIAEAPPAEPSPAPTHAPRPAYRPPSPEAPEPAETGAPSTPEPAEPVEIVAAEPVLSDFLHPAELALRTIQALSGRLLAEDAE
jgi:hypothetical protein